MFVAKSTILLFEENSYIQLGSDSISFILDEDDDLTGSGDTDDEGIEDDHDESENPNDEDNKNQHRDPGGTVKKSGTCDTLIQLCR